MASIRQGYLDDYSQNVDKVGIGTSISQEKLQVVGDVMSTGLSATGIATLTSASGFIERNLEYVENVDVDAGDNATLSGEIIVGAGLTMTVGTGATAGQGNIDSLKVYSMFQPPTGGTNQRPVGKPGSLFYNTDFKTVEFFDGNTWRQVDNVTRRGRGVTGGGHSYVSTMQAFEISTLGSAFFFGDLTAARAYIAGNVASEVRGIFGGGRNPAVNTNTIDYITIAAGGNAIDFGDQSRAYMAGAGMSSSTRGIFAGGYAPSLPDLDIEYIQISTLGNALDFGDLFQGGYYSGSVSSPTRGLYAGGHNPGPSVISTIQQLTIASLGNTVRFGDLTDARSGMASGGNSVRGIFCGGYVPTAPSGKKFRQTIDSVTIASEGNATSFGESLPSVATGISQRSGSGSNSTRAVFVGGQDNSSKVNTMEYVTIATIGNSIDFGDLPQAQRANAILSDSHGGLGGF